MESLDGTRDRTGLSRIEVQVGKLVDSSCLQHRGSPVSHSPFHLFALQVYAN